MEAIRERRIGGYRPYWLYAIQRFPFKIAMRQIWRHSVVPTLTADRLRWHWRRWRAKDRRKKQSWGTAKFAVNRDGDYFLVECPQCGTQDIWFNKAPAFECEYCHIAFTVYLEDGIVKIRDHRKGNARLPASMVFDPGAQIWRLGITLDASWWWNRRQIQRDLHDDGMDAHQHREYTIVAQPRHEQSETLGEG